ncbi:MAG: ribosome maturation factor RimM [Pseudomonadota bacterium]
MSASRDRVCLGAVAGAFGVRGDVRLKPFTADPEAIAAYGPLETEDGARRFEIRLTGAVKGGVSARLSGVGSREAAEALRGTRLYAPRDALPPPEDEDEFYQTDLLNLAVVDLSGAPLGTVRAVQNYGAGDMLEIAPSEGGKTVLLPFTREYAPHIDLAAGEIVVDPPEGLFGDAAEEPPTDDPPDVDRSEGEAR